MFCARSSQNLAENRAAPHFTCFSPPRGGGGARFFPTGANLVQRWVRAIFVHRLVGARKQENGVGNHFFWCWKSIFWCWKSIFWWKLGVGNPFFGVRKSWWNFWTVFMKLLEKHGNRAPITHPSRAPELASFQIQRNPFQIPRKASKSFPTLPNLSKSKKNLSKPPENFSNPSKSKENLSKYQKKNPNPKKTTQIPRIPCKSL